MNIASYKVKWYLDTERIADTEKPVTEPYGEEMARLNNVLQVIPDLGGENMIMIADFNDGKRKNNLNGSFGAWVKDPTDDTQDARDSMDVGRKVGESGFSVKVTYDVDSPNLSYNGFWMKLNNLDATGYDALRFDVMGDPNEGYTEVFKVELKNIYGEAAAVYVEGVSSDWQTFEVPLYRFTNLMSDAENLTEFVIVFEDGIATEKEGAIYLDNLRLVSTE
jgi:hypothetical protein